MGESLWMGRKEKSIQLLPEKCLVVVVLNSSSLFESSLSLHAKGHLPCIVSKSKMTETEGVCFSS